MQKRIAVVTGAVMVLGLVATLAAGEARWFWLEWIGLVLLAIAHFNISEKAVSENTELRCFLATAALAFMAGAIIAALHPEKTVEISRSAHLLDGAARSVSQYLLSILLVVMLGFGSNRVRRVPA
jgi:uncharacterized membrane protein